MDANTSTHPYLPADQAESLLSDIATWGNTTTIIIHGGSVFEFKGDFPEGKNAQGYYNLKGKTGFEGHLKLDTLDRIDLITKLHRGRLSHAFSFIKDDETVFKIFLGRDADGNLIESQVARFHQLEETAKHD